MFKLVLVLLFVFIANASELKLLDGKIQAHTEVFGDSTIDPQTNAIMAKIKKDNSIESINGEFSIEALSLVSDNKDRDKHMYEVLKVVQSPIISFYITHIQKMEDTYEIAGILKMNHIRKNITSQANITEKGKDITINGEFSINLSEYGLEAPTMFFLTVRDQIDIKYSFNFKEIKWLKSFYF